MLNASYNLVREIIFAKILYQFAVITIREITTLHSFKVKATFLYLGHSNVIDAILLESN